MFMQPPAEITQLLIAWNQRDQEALDQLLPLIYDTLHQLAESYMRRERADHTLQATALVNEAFLRLTGGGKVEWQNRAHFFGVAARAMRQILVEHARGRDRLKRGGGITHLTLGEAVDWSDDKDLDLVALDDALKSLEKFAPRQSRIVEMRFFGGLSVEEVAAALNLSAITIKREWALAKMWLYREISGKEQG